MTRQAKTYREQRNQKKTGHFSMPGFFIREVAILPCESL